MKFTAVYIIFAICVVVLIVLGILEKRKHMRQVERIPMRINVNGIRGKSTITRMITAMLRYHGVKVIGKTTGSAARMLYWNKDEEPIDRKPEGANIKEQIGVISRAADMGAEALVCECMAVNPKLQKIYQEEMIKAQIGVIVNVLPDHIDEMGPTLDEIALAFTVTIPYNGILVLGASDYTEYFKRIAKKRHTEVYVADESKIPEGYLDRFNYAVFPNNVAVPLALAEALGIDREEALEGILTAPADPGIATIEPVGRESDNAYFVNGFAANDPVSTLEIWDLVTRKGVPGDNLIVLANCRGDRGDRTRQMALDVIPNLPCRTVIAVGKNTKPITDAYRQGRFKAEYLNLDSVKPAKVISEIKKRIKGAVIFGIGNIHGIGEELIDGILELGNNEKEDGGNA
ncbi:MAG: poly-gamma-glutamate synthase PgsB [Clostridia bacterium]|nr:poly-gamma-glutamate synthase PgsB [Clostridia bacterium]